MNYCIVTKIEVIDNVLTHTEIGLIEEIEDCGTINNNTLLHYENWINQNKTDLENSIMDIKTYFISNPPVYSARTTTKNIWNLGLELLDVNNLP